MLEISFKDKQFRSLSKQIIKHYSPAQRKKITGQVGIIIQNDIGENIDKGKTFDGEKSPALAYRTKQHKKRIGKSEKLRISGALRKLDSKATPDKVTVWSEGHTSKASYADILNEAGGGKTKYRYMGKNNSNKQSKKPFKFAGFGKKLVSKIQKELIYWIDKIK